MCHPNAGALCLGAPHRLLMSYVRNGINTYSEHTPICGDIQGGLPQARCGADLRPVQVQQGAQERVGIGRFDAVLRQRDGGEVSEIELLVT